MNSKLINSLYKILALYEDMTKANTSVHEQEYRVYLQRTSVYFLGLDMQEIYYMILGLEKLGSTATHDVVRTSVFHMIQLIEEGEANA